MKSAWAGQSDCSSSGSDGSQSGPRRRRTTKNIVTRYATAGFIRSASAASTFPWIEGVSPRRRRNDWPEMTSRRTGVCATTVAVRGDSVSSAISPKKSPASNVATRRPFGAPRPSPR